MTEHNNNLNHRDPETDALIDELNALGAHDRSVPDSGFEQRMMDSISQQIAPLPLPIHSAPSHSTRLLPSWKFNIAAGLLVAASASILIWSSSRTAPMLLPTNQSQQTLVALEEDFDALFELVNFVDDLDIDVADLDLLTDAIHTELSLPSVLMELSENSLEGSL